MMTRSENFAVPARPTMALRKSSVNALFSTLPNSFLKTQSTVGSMFRNFLLLPIAHLPTTTPGQATRLLRSPGVENREM